MLIMMIYITLFPYLNTSIQVDHVPCCDVRIKTMFGSSLPPVVCGMARVLFPVFVFACCSCVQLILCCVFGLFPLVCPILIATSVFSNVYFHILQVNTAIHVDYNGLYTVISVSWKWSYVG